MCPSTMDLDDDDDDNNPFAGEELLDFEALVQKMSKKGVDIAPCAAINDDADAYHSPTDPGWRETLRDELITSHPNSDKPASESDEW